MKRFAETFSDTISNTKPIDFFKTYFEPKQNNQEWCLKVDTSKIGLVYIFVPDRMYDPNKATSKSEYKDNIFKLNHYYSLLLLFKLFKPSVANPLLFYYVNDWGKPRTNHYNRWFNDTYWWHEKLLENDLAKDKIVFTKIEHDYNYAQHDFNMYTIINKVKEDSMRKFLNSKISHVLLITSDIIIGPKIMTCFSRDKPYSSQANTLVNLDTIRLNMPNECFKSLNNPDGDGIYSFLYKLDVIHSGIDFSGALIWRTKNSPLNTAEIGPTLVNQFNVYRCLYKNDLMLSKSLEFFYEDTFCMFGFELNIYEPPNLQSLFLSQEHNYLYRMLRFFLYNQLKPITYKQYNHEATNQIPNIVHLIWFSSPYRGLKFIEYLCLKSILAVIKPERVRIHGDNQPKCELWKKIKQNPKIEWVCERRNKFELGFP